MVYLQGAFGDPLAFVHVQAAWNRKVSVLSPVLAFLAFDQDPDHYLMEIAAIAAVWLRVKRKAPWPETLMLALLVWLPLSTGRLLSFPRFLLTMIPAHIEFAEETTHPRLRWGFVAACVVFSIIDTWKLGAGYRFL